MADGLNIQRIVEVNVQLQRQALSRRGFGVLMIVGDSDVISGQELYRTYTTLDGVAFDFGVLAPEYLAAEVYFSQSPRPDVLMIGRWLRTPTSGFVRGAELTPTEQLISNWDTIADGTFDISVDGVPQSVTLLDFTLALNLNGVASTITSALVGATCTWDGFRFTITSNSTGATSSVSFASVEGTGTDISAQLKLDAAQAIPPVPGFDATTPLEAVVALENQSNAWYGITFAASVQPNDAEVLNIAAFIQATTTSRIYGITDQNSDAKDPLFTTSLGEQLKTLEYTRTVIQYASAASNSNAYAICSFFGRAFTVNFDENLSTITMKFKNEPTITPEVLTDNEANILADRRYNVFAQYFGATNTAIIQNGVMCGPAYFDEIQGLDWFTDAIQTTVFNLLQRSKKIPQTEAGMDQIKTAIANVCNEAVNNGLIAEGIWNAPSFGQQEEGSIIAGGYYIFSLPIALQPQAVRELRISPVIEIGAKLAGAIHKVIISGLVNP